MKDPEQYNQLILERSAMLAQVRVVLNRVCAFFFNLLSLQTEPQCPISELGVRFNREMAVFDAYYDEIIPWFKLASQKITVEEFNQSDLNDHQKKVNEYASYLFHSG
jgi:hypothetical protein